MLANSRENFFIMINKAGLYGSLKSRNFCRARAWLVCELRVLGSYLSIAYVIE